MSLVGVDDGKDAGDRFAEVVAVSHRGLDLLLWNLRVKAEEIRQYTHLLEFRRSASSDLLRPELTQLCLEVDQLLLQIILALAPKLAGADL